VGAHRLTRRGYGQTLSTLVGRRSPIDAHEVPGFVEMRVEGTVKCALQCLPEAAGQVDIRRRDHQALVRLLDADDTIERVLALLRFLLVSRQADDLILVLLRGATVQGDDARGEPVVDAMARWAKIVMRASWSLPPLPSAVMVDGTALIASSTSPWLLVPLRWEWVPA
jgi:hypothetical protein